MVNELTRRNKLADVYNENDNISSGLWWAIDRVMTPHKDVGPPLEFRPDVQQDAQLRLNRISPLCVSAGSELVTLWAMPLLAGLSKATDSDSASARLAMVIEALEGLAAGAFTKEARAEVARKAHFTPMPADLYDALAPRSIELRQRQMTLQYICEAATDQPRSTVIPIRSGDGAA